MSAVLRSSLAVLFLFAPACGVFGGGSDEGGDGDGDGGGLGDGDVASDGGTSGDGDFGGDGDSFGDGGGAAVGGTSGDGDLGMTGGTSGDGDLSGDGGAPAGCVVDLECMREVLPSTGDFGQDCVNRINQFRSCFCDDDGEPLEPLMRWADAEQCAAANAEYDAGTGQPHSGWPSTACPDESGPLSRDYAGRATNECPGWGSEEQVVSGCLEMMFSEGADWAEALGRAPTQADYGGCGDGCYSQYGHFIAMTKASHTLVACGAFEDSSGEVWSVQNFR